MAGKGLALAMVLLLAGRVLLAQGSEGERTEGAPAPGVWPSSQASAGQAEHGQELRAQLAQLAILQRRLEEQRARARRLRSAGLACYGTSAGFLLGSAVMLAAQTRAASSDDPSAVPWGQLAASFGIIGGLGTLVATALLLERDDPGPLEASIRRLELEIRLLEMRMDEEAQQ